MTTETVYVCNICGEIFEDVCECLRHELDHEFSDLESSIQIYGENFEKLDIYETNDLEIFCYLVAFDEKSLKKFCSVTEQYTGSYMRDLANSWDITCGKNQIFACNILDNTEDWTNVTSALKLFQDIKAELNG